MPTYHFHAFHGRVDDLFHTSGVLNWPADKAVNFTVIKEAIAEAFDQSVAREDVVLASLSIVSSNEKALYDACQVALYWLEQAPISYTNGVTLDGIDEGDTLGIAGHNRVVEQLRAALEG